MLEAFAYEMNRTPFEVAEAWERDLALSDCLLLENLQVIQERDPAWYRSLLKHGIRNLVLYAVRHNQDLVGFIWAANIDETRMMFFSGPIARTTSKNRNQTGGRSMEIEKSWQSCF